MIKYKKISDLNVKNSKKYVCWFSCGVASAVATKIFLTQNLNIDIDIINIPIENEHSDNARFLKDCEKWFGQKIKQYNKFKDIYDVFEKIKWINGINGASCTHNLKGSVYKEYGKKYDFKIIRFTAEENNRAKRLTTIRGDRFIYPLIEQGILKSDCLGEVAGANIEIPTMYKLGFPNNNCIGCVKGGAGYWKAFSKVV